MIAAAIISALLVQTADEVQGAYEVESGEARCSIILRPSAAQLPESNLQGETASGFAFAAPGCPARLSDAALWRLTLADGVLTLADGAGETLFEGRAEDRVWTGAAPDGEPVTLRPR
jgi:hypothetical protein